MINPHNIKVWKQKFTNRARGTKHYRAGFYMPGYSDFSRKAFKTAGEALEYGDRVLARWQRMYNSAVLRMIVASTPPTPQAV